MRCWGGGEKKENKKIKMVGPTFGGGNGAPTIRATPVKASIWASTPNFKGLVKNTLQQDL
jgi:hypothetical protein